MNFLLALLLGVFECNNLLRRGRGSGSGGCGALRLFSVWVLCGMERKANAFGNKSKKHTFVAKKIKQYSESSIDEQLLFACILKTNFLI